MLPAVVLLLSFPLARPKLPLVIACSLLMAGLLTVSLISKDRYYKRGRKDNLRGSVEHVVSHDPEARFSVVANWPMHYSTYFRMLNCPRKVLYPPFSHPPQDLRFVQDDGGFWYLDSNNLDGPPLYLKQLISNSFVPEKEAFFKRSRAVFYRFCEHGAEARQVDATQISENDIVPPE
ncbi:MAG: hypothetical protein ABIJ42_11525 [Acidobacteriota bacterium]